MPICKLQQMPASMFAGSLSSSRTYSPADQEHDTTCAHVVTCTGSFHDLAGSSFHSLLFFPIIYSYGDWYDIVLMSHTCAS